MVDVILPFLYDVDSGLGAINDERVHPFTNEGEE